MPPRKLHTADEFWEIAGQYEDRQVELVRGVIREMPLPGGEHGEIAGNIFGLIWNYVREHRLGRVTAAETGYILSTDPDTVRGPDVGFVTMARAPEALPEKHVPIAPDLAVEVISPGNSASDIQEKVIDYLNAGTRLVWVVYPRTRTVEVHTPEGTHRFGIDDTLDGGDILPGFTLPVSAIFPAAS